MIRRSPTRIELKLDDLNDFEYIQKFDKKKGSSATSADTQKLRHERIGLTGIRSIRASSNVGNNSSQASFNTTAASVTGSSHLAHTPLGVFMSEVSQQQQQQTETPPGDNSPGDLNVNITANTSGHHNPNADPLNVIFEEDRIHLTNNSNMSLDESL